MGTTYSYPASHLKGKAQDPRLRQSSSQVTSARGVTIDLPEELKTVEELATRKETQLQFIEAAELRERALTICEEVLGPEHSITLNALQNLSIVYERQGEQQKAETLYDRVFSDPRTGQQLHIVQHLEKLLTLRSELLGGEHPSTISMMFQLSRSFKGIGKRSEAARLDERVYETRSRVLGGAATATLQAAEQLAESYSHVGRFRDAAALEEITVAARKRSLGTKHSDTQRAQENLAATYSNLDRPDDAAQLQEQIVHSRTESLGEQHPETLQAQYNLARYYRAMGKDREATELEGSTRLFLEATIENLDIRPNNSTGLLQNPANVEVDQTKQMIKVFSPSKDWFPVLATIEPSTSKSWISSRVVDLLLLPVQPLAVPQSSTFRGSTLHSHQIAADVAWCGYSTQRVRRTEFRVTHDAPFDLLLGSDFLFAEAIRSASEPAQMLATQDAKDGS